MNSIIVLARAFDFAARRHAGQRRKGSGVEPYVNHLAEVALLVAEATGGDDAALVAAALLHDTVEDTGTSSKELEREFGEDVAALVLEVTDDKSLSQERRKRLQIEQAASTSSRARLLKIADKTSNLRSVAATPPLGWSLERRRAYVQWAREVVDRCRGVNAALETQFDAAVAAALRSFESDASDKEVSS